MNKVLSKSLWFESYEFSKKKGQERENLEKKKCWPVQGAQHRAAPSKPGCKSAAPVTRAAAPSRPEEKKKKKDIFLR